MLLGHESSRRFGELSPACVRADEVHQIAVEAVLVAFETRARHDGVRKIGDVELIRHDDGTAEQLIARRTTSLEYSGRLKPSHILGAGHVLDHVGDRAEAEIVVTGGESALTRFANSFIHQNVGEDADTVTLRVAIGGRVASGTTTYLDTPVVPVAAFTGPDQFKCSTYR